MKIAWLSHFYPFPPAGGALQRSYHLLRELASRHEVHLISLRKSRDRPTPDAVESDYRPPSRFCAAEHVFPIPAEESLLGRFRVLASGFWDSAPYDDRWLRNKNLAEQLSKSGSRESFDLVHLDTIGLAQYGRYFPRVPTVMNHHNIESHMMARRAEHTGGFLKRRYMTQEAEKLARWEKRWCGRYDDNFVVSSLDGQRLEANIPEAPWTVIPNGVDTQFFRPTKGDRTARRGLIFVGRMSWYPNKDAVNWLLKEIWPELLKDDPDRTLTLVGSSPPSEAELWSDDSSVRATGFVPDVRPYMNEAEIYVCPIRTGGGTRLKILDAMAMGMPIVATGMSVEGLDLEEDRHFLRAETPQDFVDAVSRLEENRELWKALATRARSEAVERFSWSRIGERLERAYQEVLGR